MNRQMRQRMGVAGAVLCGRGGCRWPRGACPMHALRSVAPPNARLVGEGPACKACGYLEHVTTCSQRPRLPAPAPAPAYRMPNNQKQYEFRVGDRVRCVDSSFPSDARYVVGAVLYDGRVVVLDGQVGWYHSHRFELVPAPTSEGAGPELPPGWVPYNCGTMSCIEHYKHTTGAGAYERNGAYGWQGARDAQDRCDAGKATSIYLAMAAALGIAVEYSDGEGWVTFHGGQTRGLYETADAAARAALQAYKASS